jgi:hypothetical protein
MGKKQIISISILLIMCLAMTGCSKDADSVSFVGVWDIDTSSFTIVYNEQVYSTHPEAIMFLKNNRDNIVKSIMKPEQIIFRNTGVDFVYKTFNPELVYTGTYTVYEIYANIYNRVFPSGITAACNSRKLELYYTTEYMMTILKNMLNKKDPDYNVFESLIISFNGVGVYYKN